MNIVNSYKVKIINVNNCLKDTISIYRNAVSFFVYVISLEWVNYKNLTTKERVNLTEKLTHSTKDNPTPLYSFDLKFYKFPSYLRRSAISDALGIVSSYYSNLENYILERHNAISNGRKFKKQAPILKLDHFKCPALYKGNMYNRLSHNKAQIKIFNGSDWVWLNIKLREQDIKYIENNCNGKEFSPLLILKGRNAYLQYSFEEKTKLSNTKLKDQVIIAVDLGLNHSAVCCAMRSDGTVIGRKFINQPIEKDRLERLLNRTRKLRTQSGKYAKLTKINTKIQNLKNEINNKTTHEIVSFAKKHNADVIVFEYLDKIKGKSTFRMRLHHWNKITLQKKVEHKAHSKGIRISRVSAKNTSALAFDGSGKVQRDKSNFSLCTFATGKKYNCDLNATYNIGSRYIIREYSKTISERKWSQVVAKVPQLSARTQCTLSTLHSLVAVL